ncbi:hypothetical protein BS50DRAFT_561994 [Corynespora cassiicola Philippines]|uniref:chitin synthase n=1 Tax=Corynespora cassiicola Philippines TaxID=1448308 RepID=A0A2T2N9A2_CORCC|nr:hypothetical protein BS50DRAFT_561994 [Corynespora cassiicola Philippines]
MEMAMETAPGSLIANGYKNIPATLRRRTLSFSSRKLRSTIEHLPTVNAQRLKWEKHVFLFFFFTINLTLAYMSTKFSKYYWILLPITILRPLIDCTEIFLVIVFYIIRRANPRVPKIPEKLENLVYLLPCYNESYEELMNSLNSLADQKHLDGHRKAVVIVCDGRCKGKGMTKTTAEHLTEDIIESPSSIKMRSAYTAWDDTQMNAEIVTGEFKGLKVFCIIKEENRGKRDGIILARSFLHKFNLRDTIESPGIISSDLFQKWSKFLIDNSMLSVEYVVGMDADTRFDEECVFNLMQTAREGEQVVGVCGYILADFSSTSRFSLPYLYQNAEYAIGQYRRRLRQNLTTRKVTCLPGCCQILRVVESTCGDEVLKRFGYYPRETDGLFRTIRSMMSEDRDHVCLVLDGDTSVETRQCLTARAYTSVPQTYPVFLSQRRRWTLGPMTSDSMLAIRNTSIWLERIAAASAVMNWSLNLSMFFAKFIREDFDRRTRHIFFVLVLIRQLWDFSIVFISPRSFIEAVQFIIGAFMCVMFGPMIGFTVQMYSLYKLNDFRWGKTRVVVSEDQVKSKPNHVRS